MDSRDNLRNFQDRVNLYFDKALNKEEEKEMMKEMDTNPECGRIFKSEEVYRNLVKQNTKKLNASQDLINMVRSKVGI